MAKRPGVSATFHIIAVKDQHCLLYIKHIANATPIVKFFLCFCFEHFSYYSGSYSLFQQLLLISRNIQIEE